jgi:hypothetical protein
MFPRWGVDSVEIEGAFLPYQKDDDGGRSQEVYRRPDFAEREQLEDQLVR